MAWFENALRRDLELSLQGFEIADSESIICGGALAEMQLAPFVARLRQSDVREVRGVIEKRLVANEQSAFWEEIPEQLREFRKRMGN